MTVGTYIVCREPDCHGEPLNQRGPYAGLCSAHKAVSVDARRERMQTRRNGGVPLTDGETRELTTQPSNRKQQRLRDAIEGLLPIADLLEDKAEAHALTRQDLQAVVHDWRERLTVIGRIAQGLVNQGTGKHEDT